jgi:hypothetical protein
METTFTRHDVPSYGTVMIQQLRVLWLSRRALLPLVAMLGSFVVLEALSARVSGFTWSLAEGDILALGLLVGGGWGFIVWRDEGPSRRLYHWSMPVDTAAHDLMRVLAGAMVLLGAIVLFCGVAAIAASLRGGDAAPGVAGPGVWLVYLTGPLTMYLLASVLGVALDRPFEWAFLLNAGLLVVVLLGSTLDIAMIPRVLHALGDGGAGLGTALTGGLRLAGAGTPGLLGWLGAAVLWLGISAAAVCGAAAWRRGRG